jgi:pimeloyl-ACP methyl ester carboxylesterase
MGWLWKIGEQRAQGSHRVVADAVQTGTSESCASPRQAARALSRSVGALALVFTTLVVLVPTSASSATAVEPDGAATSELSVQNGATPSATLEIDPADVTCGAGTVKINGQINWELQNLTSSLFLDDVPNGWTVRSTWEVVTSGGDNVGPQTLSLGGVDTPVINPANESEIGAVYVDDVRFGALVNGPVPTVFTYTVTTQLLDDQSQWMSGTEVSVECGGAVAITTSALNASVPITNPAAVQTMPVPDAINWGPCADPDALANEECATVEVPLDHFANDGIVIELALNRFPASGVSNGPVMTNPGGPGNSGLDWARGIASFAGTFLTESYDIIGMDPRGVADSSPAPLCISAPLSNAGLDNPLDPDWTAYFNDAVPAVSAANTGCSVAAARYLRFLGTRQVAADIDWIRRAEDVTRGGSPLDMHYWGGSYGTRLGEVYLQQFGDHAGYFVLSGAVDPATSFVDFWVDRAGPPDQVAQQLFFPAAPAQTEDQFFEVVQALTPGPNQTASDVSVAAIVDAEVTDITLGAFLTTVGVALRSEPFWATTVSYIADTWANVVGGQSVNIASPPAPEFGDLRSGNRAGNGLTTSGGGRQQMVADASSYDEILKSLNEQMMQNVVNCIDLPGVPTSSAQMASIANAAVPGDPVNYLGWIFLYGLHDCAGLAVPTGDNSADKVWPALTFPAGTPAPLVIGSVGDTATPFVWSEALVDFFDNAGIPAVLLTYEGAEHVAGAAWPWSSCVSAPIAALFAGEGLPAPDARCPFISFLNRQPPVGVRAQAGAGDVTLTWTLSSQRLGGTVEGYVVEQRRLPGGDWERVGEPGGSCATIRDQPDATLCTVGGLSNGVAYQFRVATLPGYEPAAMFSEVSNDVTLSTDSPSSDPVPPTFTG